MKILSLAAQVNSSFSCLFFSRRCCGDIGRTVAAGIDAAAGIAMNTATNITNAAMNKKTNATNKTIAAENNATAIQIHNDDMNFNAEQAQIQRDWDSAASQRQRLIEAGYNPLMIGDGFSDGGQSAASAPSAPSLDTAVMNPTHIDEPDAGFLSRLLLGSQVENYNADTQNKLAEAALKELTVEKFPETWQSEQDLRIWEKKNLVKMNSFIVQNTNLLRDQFRTNQIERLYKRALKEEADALRDMYRQNTQFAAELHPKNLKMADVKIEELRSQTRKNYTSAALDETQTDLNVQELDFNDATFYDRVKNYHLQNQLSAEQLIAYQKENERRVFALADSLQNLDLNEQERVAFAVLLEQNPNLSASDLLHAIDAVGNKREKEWSRTLKKEAISIAKQVAVAGLVAAAIYFSGGTASAAVLGALGSGAAVKVAESPTLSPIAPEPQQTSSVATPWN